MSLLRQFVVAIVLIFASATDTVGWQQTVSEKIDGYIDLRFEAPPDATQKLLNDLADVGLSDLEELEHALRSRRATYPDPSGLIGKYTTHDVECYHVDYSSKFLLYVPADWKPDKQTALVIVGHGGNSSMSASRAESTARDYLQIYAPGISKQHDAIVVAPVSERGWGHIGNSLVFSTISKLQRMFPIDPDRIHITGQSMGGHLSYRAALSLPDRWGAVSPHSGGYDFVARESIGNLINVPGYAIWGVREPYGINKDNRTNSEWGQANGLDWTFVEKNGGHTIYKDELPKVADFFHDHPRNLYRASVYMRQGGSMVFEKTWQIKGWPDHNVFTDTRPLRWNLRHWIEIQPRSDLKLPLSAFARRVGDNHFEIQSENVRNLSIYLHPKTVDFEKPIVVNVNGDELFNALVVPDPGVMFDLAREFDDRGRIFWARIEMEVSTDQAVEIQAIQAEK